MSQVCIRGVGCYAPDTRLTNQELATRLGVTEDYIVKLTGVRERRRAALEEATSDMAVRAGPAALHEAGVSARGVESVLVAAAPPHPLAPATSAMFQQPLAGLPG